MNENQSQFSENNPYKVNPYGTKFNRVSRDIVLPLLALAEVIGTKGRSQGQTSLGLSRSMRQAELDFGNQAMSWEEMQRKNRAEAIRKEAAERKAKQDEEQFGWNRESHSWKKKQFEDSQIPKPKDPIKKLPMPSEADINRIYDPQLRNLAKLALTGDEAAKELFWKNYKSEVPPKPDKKIDPKTGEPFPEPKKRLGERTIKSISDIGNAPELLKDLGDAIKNNPDVMGPTAGRLLPAMGKMPFVGESDKVLRSQAISAMYESVRQLVAKNAMEGGVLRAEDIPKYNKIFGDIKSKPQAAAQNLEIIKNMLARDYNAFLDRLRENGYNVPYKYMDVEVSPITQPRNQMLGQQKPGNIGTTQTGNRFKITKVE